MKYFVHSIFFSLLIGFPVQSFCQGQLSVKETGEISYQAKNVISELEQLLNFIAFSDNPPSAVAEVIEKSYTPNARNQVFYNASVIIEDDSEPDYRLSKTKDLPVDKYIHTLDIYYSKSVDPSIIFSNVRFSNVKKKDYVYLKAVFECEFTGKHTQKNAPYKPRTRQALIRAERTEIVGKP